MVNKANTSQNTSINKSGGALASGAGAGGSTGAGAKKRKVKRLSNQNAYYLSAFISNPCEQLFGPSLAYSIDLNTSADQKDKSSLTNDSNLDDLETSAKSETETQATLVPPVTTSTEVAPTPVHETDRPVSVEPLNAELTAPPPAQQHENSFEYIPAPRWNKAQNSILEELFKKSRYPKSAELKQTAQRLHVMDTDVEVSPSSLFPVGPLQSQYPTSPSFKRSGSGSVEAVIERRAAKTRRSRT